MLASQSELLSRVGQGTPAGDMFRRHWLPACLSTDIPGPDCDPFGIRILGEDLVAFRDTEGKVGILDEHCCHRGASLLLGRNEGCGLRCLYHGWKFAVDGTLLETPNNPDPKFRARLKHPAFPVHEAGGFVWVYLGPAEAKPPFPDFAFAALPERNRMISSLVYDCNYLQAMEGGLDTSHLGVLHGDALHRMAVGRPPAELKALEMTAPRIEVARTRHGLDYASIRDGAGKDGTSLVRVTTFIAPFTVCIAPGGFWAFFIPVDDNVTMNYLVNSSPEIAYGEEPQTTDTRRFFGVDSETLDAYGVSRTAFNREGRPSRSNNFRQDRAAMRNGDSYAGVPQFLAADYAVACSMGHIANRTKEHLAPIDAPIAQMRQVLLDSIKLVAEGKMPYGAGMQEHMGRIDAASGWITTPDQWRELVPEHVFV